MIATRFGYMAAAELFVICSNHADLSPSSEVEVPSAGVKVEKLSASAPPGSSESSGRAANAVGTM